MSDMIIEVRKAGFINKGAELMLYAVVQKLRSKYPNAIFTMSPNPGGSQPFRKIVDLGFYPKVSLFYKGYQWGRIGNTIPRIIRNMYGLILDREVDVVIDAAGFSYGDQWGSHSCDELNKSSRRWKSQGTKVILMPQAFGPFSTRRIRKDIKNVISNVDLIMPRDKKSYEYLIEAAGLNKKICLYPDFTNLLDGHLPDYFDHSKYGACIIPNCRMLDKAPENESRLYIDFMVKCAQRLKESNVKPFILVHEGKLDMQIAQQISASQNLGIPIIAEDSAINIKGIIGASTALVCSRFHGLVSALSQGVPCLGTGWSHKYKALFEDYSYPEGLISVDASGSEIIERIDQLIDSAERDRISAMLLHESARLKLLTERMWNHIYNAIGSSAA